MPSRLIWRTAEALMGQAPTFTSSSYDHISEISSAAAVAGAPKAPAPPQGQIADMEMRLERQNLLLQTLLMILLEKKVIHEDEFTEWMDYVDELDGVKDGRLKENRAPQECPSCKRRSPRNAVKCIYCGTDFPTTFLAGGKPGQ